MSNERLESWKEIAAYLNRDLSTVRRWEQSEGLPVHRHQHQARSSVYAFRAELDAWRDARRVSPGRSRADRPSAAGTIAAALAVVVLSGAGRFVGPASAGEQENGVAARLEWSGQVYNFGQVTRDGRYLSVTSGDTGDLAVVELATGEMRKLTNGSGFQNELVEFSVPSPDGKRFAYSWYEPTSEAYELRLASLDGGEPAVLVRNPEIKYLQPFDWSPDGTRIVATIQRGDISQLVLVSVPGGQVTVLKSGGWFPPSAAAFSADGRFIAYSLGGIRVIATDGSREEEVAIGPSVTGLLGWLPDGTSLLFTATLKGSAGIWMVPVREGRVAGETTLVRAMSGRIGGLGIESNGNVHYQQFSGGRTIYLADFDSQTGTVVGTPVPIDPSAIGGRHPAWSPDGTEIAFIQTSMQQGPSVGSLAIQSPATGQVRQIPLNLSYPRYPTWLPDGKRMLVQGRDGKGRESLFRVELDTGSVTRLCDAASTAPVVSKDGSTVYVRREVSETESVVVAVNLANGSEQVALAESTNEFELSPDNSTWFVVPTTRGARLKRRTGSTEQNVALPVNRVMLRGDWTPDGSRLLVVGPGERGMQVLSLAADDGAVREAGVEFAGGINGVSVSPDGARLAISASEGSGGAEVWVLSGLMGAARR